MINTAQNWKQMIGLEPMTEEEFRASIEAGLKEVESGELVPAEKVFANLERKYSKDAGIQNRAYQSR